MKKHITYAQFHTSLFAAYSLVLPDLLLYTFSATSIPFYTAPPTTGILPAAFLTGYHNFLTIPPTTFLAFYFLVGF